MRRTIGVSILWLALGISGALLVLAAPPAAAQCSNGDCPPPPPDCTNGDCPPPPPDCTNGDCPQIPEPATALLLGTGMAGVLIYRTARRRRAALQVGEVVELSRMRSGP